ncbi:MAG: heme-binding protein [Gemmatimonadota bacterium]
MTHTTNHAPLRRLAKFLSTAAIALAVLATAPAAVDAQLTLAQATTAMDAAEAEARANGWNLTILIVDAEGVPVYLRRMDGASARTNDIVGMKVHVVLTTGGTTRAYGEALAAGTVDSIPGGIHYEGGLPIRINGEMVGAMAASGARGSEDAQVVRAALEAIGAEVMR